MAYSTPHTSPPWRFRLIALTAIAIGVALLIVVRAAMARERDASGRAQLVAELRRLDDLQVAWEARRGIFATRVAPSGDDSTLTFVPPPGVRLRFETGPGSGWSATATNEQLRVAPRHCGIYRGPAETAPHRALTAPGEVRCW